MERRLKGAFRVFCFSLLGFLILIPPGYLSYAQENTNKKVLILNSYHRGYKWTDDITEGIESVLKAENANATLYIEYMDTKRISDEHCLALLYEIYKHKFRDVRFDVIISSDDDAFNFLRRHQDEIFLGTPVVFCGVNYFKGSDLEGYDLFTGVNEEADFKAGIEIALRLHPDTKRIVVINDTTTTGLKIHEKLMEIIPDYRGSVDFVLLEDIEMERIQQIVKGLTPDSLVFFTTFFRDKSGRFFEYDESISLIAKGCNVPIYGAWDLNLGYGIMGGMLTSGYYQGEAAAKMALRILGGEKVTDIPVIKESPNRYMFDYSQLDRFEISLSELPKGSIVINKPHSFYSDHKGLVWGVIAGIAGLALTIFILSTNIFKRKRAEEKLQEAHDRLEERVIDRTKDLDGANKQLNLELTERKQAEEALVESEERYRSLVQNVPIAVYRTIPGPKGRFLMANPAFLKMFGLDSERELKKITVADVWINPKDRKAFSDTLLAKGSVDAVELPLKKKDGTPFWGSVTARVVYDEGGKTSCFDCTIMDITARKEAEEQREKLQAQLQRAQKMEAIGTLAGGVAHDLNNILAGLVSYPELLLMEMPKRSPLRKPILTIQKSGEKAATIVQDLLTLARRGVVATEVVNLNDIISEHLKSPEYERLKSYHPNVQLKTGLEGELLNILGSPVHLSKTVMNLVSNAAEAMPYGGDISISTENRYIDRPIRGYDHIDEGDYVILTVSDTGTGISPEDMERIFEPFYTKKVMGRSGTGLGMAVVWGTVKDHKGYIDVKSAKGKGTVVTIYFPVSRKELDKEKSGLSIEVYMGKGESVLIVDDVAQQRHIASRILNKLHYSVTTVSSGEEAIDYLKDNSANLLLLDMIMEPGIDGYETYNRILEFHPNQKAIIVSGFSETKRVKAAQRLGAGAYVKKPFLLEKIGLAVRKELDK